MVAAGVGEKSLQHSQSPKKSNENAKLRFQTCISAVSSEAPELIVAEQRV
jgi:hypothetical protein